MATANQNAGDPAAAAAVPVNSNAKTGGDDDPVTFERAGIVREVGTQGVWSLSSCKPGEANSKMNRLASASQAYQPVTIFTVHTGFGVEQLRDNCMDTYWQSDGQLPHLVNIQFQRKIAISHICMYTDYKLDESYTPSRISLRAGTHFNDLREIELIDLTEPAGWVSVPLRGPRTRAFMVQIAVISNHQNGRDTHMRQIRIHSPIEGRSFALEQCGPFSTLDCQKYMTIR